MVLGPLTDVPQVLTIACKTYFAQQALQVVQVRLMQALATHEFLQGRFFKHDKLGLCEQFGRHDEFILVKAQIERRLSFLVYIQHLVDIVLSVLF